MNSREEAYFQLANSQFKSSLRWILSMRVSRPEIRLRYNLDTHVRVLTYICLPILSTRIFARCCTVFPCNLPRFARDDSDQRISTYERTDGRTDGRTNERTNERADGVESCYRNTNSVSVAPAPRRGDPCDRGKKK